MPKNEASRTTCPGIGKIGVSERTEDGRNDSGTKRLSNEENGPDSSEIERVLKEVGSTSTTFIGPALPPKTKQTSDIDNALSDFYKELEDVETPDCANGNQGKQEDGSVHAPTPSNLSNAKETQLVNRERIVNTGKSRETDSYQEGGGQKQSSWPHWYKNDPYNHRRPRPGYEPSSGRAAFERNQWQHPQPREREPSPRFHRPHCPAPPPEFANPRNPPLNMNVNWNESHMPNLYQDDSHFPRFCRFPPPNICTVPSQGFDEHPFDTNEQSHRYNAQLENVTLRRSRDREEEWYPFGADYDGRQRFDSENNHWEKPHPYRPPDDTRAYHHSLVLILMRGLPGSGKSTRARELLSMGPSGLILSTDDYFDYKDGYYYEPGLLGVAHEWNQSRAKGAIQDGRSPIIIDNTNLQAWEMKPYVKMALERGYEVDFCEPDTSWKFDPYELEKRNKHGVPQEKIAQMLDRYSFPISIDIVLSSQEPAHVIQRHRPHQPPMMRKQDF